MKTLKVLAATLLTPFLTQVAHSENVDPNAFIKDHAPMAIAEMARTGIPASITLAQAILESSWGQSKVAENGNNFFCIKCKDWKGATISHQDDEDGPSCFRAYSSIEASFKDHSEFLVGSERYKKLFDYKITEFGKWAQGLQDCGYATDPNYAEKLIDLIERYALHIYDRGIPFAETRILESDYELDENFNEQPESFPTLKPTTSESEGIGFESEGIEQKINSEPKKLLLAAPTYSFNSEPTATDAQPYMELVETPSGELNEQPNPLVPGPRHHLKRRP